MKPEPMLAMEDGISTGLEIIRLLKFETVLRNQKKALIAENIPVRSDAVFQLRTACGALDTPVNHPRTPRSHKLAICTRRSVLNEPFFTRVVTTVEARERRRDKKSGNVNATGVELKSVL